MAAVRVGGVRTGGATRVQGVRTSRDPSSPGVRRAAKLASVRQMRGRNPGGVVVVASGSVYGKSMLDTSIVSEFRRSEADCGSPEAQIAMFTARIRQLTKHLTENRRDHQCSRGLKQLLGRRRKMLEYLYKEDSDKYVDICTKLGIRQTIKITPRPR